MASVAEIGVLLVAGRFRLASPAILQECRHSHADLVQLVGFPHHVRGDFRVGREKLMGAPLFSVSS